MKNGVSCLRRGRLKAETLQRAADTLRLLAHPQRLRLIELLERERAAPVHLLIAETGFPQAVVSQHLNQMRRIGLLAVERRGKERWYRLADPRALSILSCICTHCSETDFERL